MRNGSKPIANHFNVAALLAATASVLLSALLVGVAPASAACPNDPFRVGPAALLPECRAYEMVSPPDKNGGNLGRILWVRVSPSGDAATFYSSAAFAGSPSSALSTGYIAHRGANWATESLDPPQRNTGNSLLMSTFASTEDLGFSLSASNRAVAPGAIEGGSNLYLRNNATGVKTLLYAHPEDRLFNQATGLSGGLFLGATPDWSHIIIRAGNRVPLTEDSPPSDYGYLYDLSEGELHLLNIRPDGTFESEGAATTVGAYRPYTTPISADGRRVFLELGSSFDHPVYIREDNETTYPISVSELDGEAKDATLDFTNRAGTQVYFTSFQKLTAGAPNNALYRYDVATKSLTNLIPFAAEENAGQIRTLGVSQDGSDVYLTATGALGDGAEKAPSLRTNLYSVHDGEVRWHGVIDRIPPSWQTSPSGRYFSIAAFADLTGDKVSSSNCPSLTPEYNNQAGECMDVYVYDSALDELSCATCSGGDTRAHSRLGGQFAREQSIEMGTEFARAMIDDGTVFFETAGKLVARDRNSVEDAYSWRDGSPELVSSGQDPNPSFFGTATPDGRSALFLTNEQLVGTDTDNNIDLYAARIGGGLASQWPPGAPAGCLGEACRPPGPAPPATLRSGTAVAAASGRSCAKLTARSKALRAGAKKLSRKARAAARRKGKASAKRARKLRKRAAAKRRTATKVQKQAINCRGNR